MKIHLVSLSIAMALVTLGAGARAEEVPLRLRIAVVLDASRSMNDQDPGKLAVVAARLLVDLATPEDEVTLILFGTGSQVIGRDVVRDEAARAQLASALELAQRDQWCTDYRVGLRAALDALGTEDRPGERRLVIFLTDGLYDADRSNESYYTTDEGREQLERAARSSGFAERPCTRSYTGLVRHVEPGFLAQMAELTRAFSASGVRLYTVGLGSDLNRTTPEAERSRAMLHRLASATGGAFLAATRGDQLPVFFASIYSALVGAPVEDPRESEDETIEFEVLRGARRVAVVADAAGDRELALALVGPDGATPPHDLRPFNVDTSEAHGYRMLSLDEPRAGRYRIRRTRGQAGLRIQVIQEVGLRLLVEGLPQAATDGVAPHITLALRSSAGEPVQLSPRFLSQIGVSLSFGAEGGEAQPEDLRLASTASVARDLGPLGPGRYVLEASASHTQGLLDVPPVRASVEVLHQITIDFTRARIAFDFMAEDQDGFAEGVSIGLAQGSSLPVDQEFTADWGGLAERGEIEVGPDRFTLGPEQRSVPVTFRFRDQRSLRDASGRYQAVVKVRPASTELFQGEPQWEVLDVDGTLRPWDWWRYYEEYKIYIWSGVGAFLLLVLLVGLVARARWPKRAKLYYLEIDSPTFRKAWPKLEKLDFIDIDKPLGSESVVRLGRESRSWLPYRSDRHRCGRGGRPRKGGKTRYCDIIARRGGFLVVPRDRKVGLRQDGEEKTTARPIAGHWGQWFKLDTEFVIWLTRD